jgi:pimeloyl-ACP methyl ester carboxylesterase
VRSALEHRRPPDAPPPGRPDRSELWKEWRLLPELVRLGLATPALRRLPRGDGGPVLLIPGWKAPEATMAPLRRYLAWLGHDARHWGLGRNRGRPEADTERLAQRVVALVAKGRRPVTLIGWSLGGAIAREVARLVPGSVAQVITYGSPVVGGPTHTVGASRWGLDDCARIARRIAELDASSPLRVPVTAIFSRSDEIVSWPACIDRVSPRVRHFEVWSTHVGLGIDPAVWTVIARSLAGGGARSG